MSDDALETRQDPAGPTAPPLVVALALGLLALIASEVLFEVRLAASTSATTWGGLVGVLGLAGLPFVAPLILRTQREPRLRVLIQRAGLALAICSAAGALVALAFAPIPLASVGEAGGLALGAFVVGAPALAPALVYATRKTRPSSSMVSVLVSVCVLMPGPAVGGPALAALLLWRKSLVERMP